MSIGEVPTETEVAVAQALPALPIVVKNPEKSSKDSLDMNKQHLRKKLALLTGNVSGEAGGLICRGTVTSISDGTMAMLLELDTGTS